MDLFDKAKVVRLRSKHGKYLWANDDAISVSQSREGAHSNAKWKVEFVEGGRLIRLRSCHDTYLTASSTRFLTGMTGKKVAQSVPDKLGPLVEWEPVKDGYRVKLKTHFNTYMRANFGVPPWRDSVTHNCPERTATQEWVLWDVEITEIFIPPSPASSTGKRDNSNASDQSQISSKRSESTNESEYSDIDDGIVNDYKHGINGNHTK